MDIHIVRPRVKEKRVSIHRFIQVRTNPIFLQLLHNRFKFGATFLHLIFIVGVKAITEHDSQNRSKTQIQ